MTKTMRESAREWLARQFEFEYCDTCGGDAQHHEAMPFMGGWFAHCMYPPSKDTNWEQHPAITAFRVRADKADRERYPADPE